MNKIFYKFILSVLLLGIYGCSSVRIEDSNKEEWLEASLKTPLNSDSLGFRTSAFLYANNLTDAYDEDPDKVLEMLADYLKTGTKRPELRYLSPLNYKDYNRTALAALTELCYDSAKKADKGKKLKYYLSCSYYAWNFLFNRNLLPQASPFDSQFLYMTRFYNFSTAEVFRYFTEHKIPFEKVRIEIVGGAIDFAPPKSDLYWPPKDFKKFLICYDYKSEGLQTQSMSPGLGVPLVGIKDLKPNIEKAKEWLFINESYAMNVLLLFPAHDIKAEVCEAEFEFSDAMKNDFTSINGQKVPLELDFSTPLAKFLQRPQIINGIKFMFSPDRMGSLEGIYMMSPYNPEKIPLLFVHGLMSDPRTWVQTANTLSGVKRIRDNYQV
jgi:hypothetical protein